MNDPRSVNLGVAGQIDLLWKDTTKWEYLTNKCQKSLNSALSHWPNHPILNSNMGAIYEYQFNRDKALKYLLRAIELGANDRHTYYNIGVVKTNLGHENAMNYCKIARESSERDDTFKCYIDFQAL